MLQAGKNITQPNDPLVKLTPEQLFYWVKNPKPEIEAAIRQLRLVKSLDTKRYNELKRNLPYVVCGIFNPAVRRTEHFAWIDHFILDFDHLTEKNIDLSTLRNLLSTDPQIVLLFASPGNDGLKVLFRLSEKCYDAAKYKLFYKLFARSFARQYQLDQVLDGQTCDVTRACFVSMDPDAYYDPTAEPVRMEAYVDYDNPDLVHDLKQQVREEEQREAEVEGAPVKEAKPPIEEDALKRIKATLNPNYRQKQEKVYYVPEEIDKVIQLIVERMEQVGITTHETRSISYGKKFRFSLGVKQAEINVFYGKRGYSVVQSPRQGTNSELNEVTAQIISELLT